LSEGERLEAIPGTVPNPLVEIRGCPFLSRCPEGEPALCGAAMPALRALSPDRRVACYKRGSGPEPDPAAAPAGVP
jgi:ABC-type dipeptide/oligopeptide/nickel transport system ATPase component